jgi:hypothetical protein
MTITKNNRTFDIAIGICFILATLFYATGNGILTNMLATQIITSPLLGIGVILELLNSLAVIALGLLMYHRLKKTNQSILLGYAFSRVIEGVLLIVGSTTALLALTLSDLHAISVVANLHTNFFNVAMLVLGIYSTFFFTYLLKKSIGPKLLMSLGVIAYLATTIYAALSIIFSPEIISILLFIPGGIFELLFPIWLIVKGFKD